jgi:hypothetical protein
MMRPLHIMLALLCSLGLLLPKAECSPCAAGGCGGEPTKQSCCCCDDGGACDENIDATADDHERGSPIAEADARAATDGAIRITGHACCCTTSNQPVATANRADAVPTQQIREVPRTVAGADTHASAGTLAIAAARSHPPPLPAHTRRAVLCVYTI